MVNEEVENRLNPYIRETIPIAHAQILKEFSCENGREWKWCRGYPFDLQFLFLWRFFELQWFTSKLHIVPFLMNPPQSLNWFSKLHAAIHDIFKLFPTDPTATSFRLNIFVPSFHSLLVIAGQKLSISVISNDIQKLIFLTSLWN